LENTRQKIIEAAKKVFAEKSFFDATLEDIAEHSGVKKSTIYYYFTSKLDLLMEVVHEVLEELAIAMESTFVPGSVKNTLYRLVDCYCSFFAQKSDFFFVLQRAAFDLLTHAEACQRFQEIVAKFQETRKKLAERIGEVVTKRGQSIAGDTLLRMILSSIAGYCMEELREGRKVTEKDREILKEVLTAFLV
jgi:AcrR family transcriptional regulator